MTKNMKSRPEIIRSCTGSPSTSLKAGPEGAPLQNKLKRGHFSSRLGGQFHGEVAAVGVRLDLAIDDGVPFFHKPSRLRVNASGKLGIQTAFLAQHAPVRGDVGLSGDAFFLGRFGHDAQKNSRDQRAGHIDIVPVGQTSPNL